MNIVNIIHYDVYHIITNNIYIINYDMMNAKIKGEGTTNVVYSICNETEWLPGP